MTRPAEAAPPLPPLPADPNEFWRNLAYGIAGAAGSGQSPFVPLSAATNPATQQLSSPYDVPVFGGLLRRAVEGPTLEEQRSPFLALGPVGELASGLPTVVPPLARVLGVRASGEAGAAIPAAARAAVRASEVQPPMEAGGLGGFVAGEGGAAPLGPLGQRIAARAAEVNPSGVANEALAAARGAEVAPQTGGALKPGSSAAEVAAARASEATSVARPTVTTAEGATVPSPRYVPVVGNSRSYVRDTVANEDLPQIFGGKDHAEKAVADANARNGVQIAETNAKIASEAVIPPGHPLRELTTDQLGALRRVTTDPADQKAIDALLGERAFAVAPDAKLTAAVEQVPGNIQSQVRKALRTKVGDEQLTPDALVAAPGMRAVLDGALGAAKVDANLANRRSLAQQLIDKGRMVNGVNAAKAAKRATGDPVVDKVVADFTNIEADVKAGATPVETFEDTIDAVAKPALESLGASPYRSEVTGPPDMAAVRAATAERRAAMTGEQQAAVKSASGAPAMEGEQTLLTPSGEPPSGVGGNLPPVPPLGPTPQPSEGAAKTVKDLLWSAFKGTGTLAQATRQIAGGDFSAAGSQTFPVLFNHPVSYVKGVLAGALDNFRNEVGFLAEQARYKRLIAETGIAPEVDKGGLISEIGGGIVKSEEKTAGIDWIREKIPALENIPVLGGVAKGYGKYLQQTEQAYIGTINAVRTQAYLGSLKFYEWAYGRPLSLAEKQGLAHDIRVITGRGFNFPKQGEAADTLVAVAKLANGMGFSPQLAFARARLITDTPKAVARIAWDIGHGAPPRPQDLEFLRGTFGYAASVAGMWGIAHAAGLNVDTDLDSPRFGLIDLGKPSHELGAAAAAGEFMGMRTQTYGGHVYVDPGQGVGQDLKLLFRLIGPMFGKLPRDQKGNAWNPWAPKGTEASSMDLLVRFFGNKLLPGYGAVESTAAGHPPDLADPTQNPVTAFLLPMFVQGGLQATGETQPGGALYAQGLSALSPSDIEKKRLQIDVPTVPGMNTLSADRQKQFDDQVSAAVKLRLDALIQTPKYQAAKDTEREQLIQSNTTAVGRDTKRNLAIQIATSGAPSEIVPAMAVALAQSPDNLKKGAALAALDASGRLTPDVAANLDGLRKQTDRAKPSYDPTVAELTAGKKLADRWLASPEFFEGTKAEWDLAAETAAKLRLLRADAERRKVDPREDDQIIKFYEEQGGPLFTQLYTFSGAKNPNAIPDARKEIQKDPLWTLVASAANRLDHPQVATP